MATINKIKGTDNNTYDLEVDWSNVTSKPTIPTKVSQLANDSLFYYDGREGMSTNPFAPTGYRGMYISKIDNAFYCADKRWTVTAKNQNNVAYPAGQIGNLFNGDYESTLNIADGDTCIISIKFGENGSTSGNDWFPGYPYGYMLLSFYYEPNPTSVTARAYCNYEPQGTGWKNMTVTNISSGQYANAYRIRNDWYAISEFEITIVGRAANGRTSNVTQLEMHLDRPYSGRNPFLSKYASEELYYDLKAPHFVGALTGNADTATALSNQGHLNTQEKLDNFSGQGKLQYATFSGLSSVGTASNDGMILSIPWTSGNYGYQMAFDDATNALMKVRGRSNGNWGNWYTVHHDGNTTIPTETTVSGWGFTKNTGTYSKPSTGIPKTDLASDVQTSLGKADTALQSHQSLAGYATETWVTNKGYTTNTGTITGIKMNGASKGTSGVVDLGTVLTSDRLFPSLVPTGTNISASNVDLNTTTYLTVGRYYCGSDSRTATFTNCPTNRAFMMWVYSPLSTTIDNETTSTYIYRLRELTTYTGEVYHQSVNSNGTAGVFTYGPWKQVSHNENLATVALNGEYGSLQNLPVVPTVVSELPNDAGYLDSTSFITTGGQTIVDSGALVSFSDSWNVSSNGGTSNAYTFYLEVIETSVNTVSKTSDVTYKVYAKGNNSFAYNSFSDPTVTIKVDGTSLGAVQVNKISTTKTLIATKSNTVAHNADGTKTISVTVQYANSATSYLPKPHTSSAYSVTLSTFTETEGVDIAGIRTPNGKVYNLADTYAREQIENISNVGYTMLTGTAGCIGRKWDNGFLEYWIVKAISAGAYTAWQSHYYRNVNASITYPIPFVTELGTLAQYNNPTSYASQPYATSKTATQTVRLMAFTNQSSLTGTLYMYVWGYWK